MNRLAQQLNSSTAQQLGLLIVLLLSGCSSPIATGRSADSSVANGSKRTVLEAGIVLAGRPGYWCLPLEQAGLAQADEIVSLDTSCDCIAPRLVKYATASSALATGILLEYVDESVEHAAGSSLSPPADLGVIVTVMLSDGRSHEFSINLLHTHLIEEELP